MASRFLRIPAENLSRQYQQIRWEISEAVERVLASGKYTLGPMVQEFEGALAEYCGLRHCVGISNGTEALHLALAAMGVGPGDEVITQANTYVATAFAISYLGAKPVFVDVEPEYGNMDVSQVEAKITGRTKAIIPVHMHGHPVDMDPLMELAARRNLKVLEDASHAAGATYRGRYTCALGHAAAISFYPAKVLGAYGDGGAVLTNDDDLDHQLRILRYMGQEVKHTHLTIGYQQRLDPIQAAILLVKLRHLDDWIDGRRRVAAQYNGLLKGLPLHLPEEAPDCRHVYYMYTIHTPMRDALARFLVSQGIETQMIYPTPVPMQPCYRSLDYQDEDIPVAAKLSRELLCLPMFPELSEMEVSTVASGVRKFFE
jgi:dTDP-4-amino-4,6-dideoxygalactose transaminase